ncbi:MAG: hypothetical protein RMK84_19445 [Oscillochloridaceae bacterium]|nr:hypothetical protein [Chloroflexaceae bacterium]MDW8392302.1 hypothetical protein [Oscillochloridaceae bacterium]
MSEQYTFTVEVYTDALVVAGSYDLPLYRRVSDALNSGLHRFITLRDASVAPPGRLQQARRVPQILVDWSGALLVATIAEPPPPPDFHVPNPPRDTQTMMFFTSQFALRADFFKRGDVELIVMLSEMTDEFVPLSAVTIYPLQGGAPFHRESVCLNRRRVQALYAIGAEIAHGPLPAPNPEAFAPPVVPTPPSPAAAEPPQG